MIPSHKQIQKLWDTFALPPYKRDHCREVARLALWFASALTRTGATTGVNMRLLEAAALLHDIDKMAPKRLHEHHPDTAVRILREGHMEEVSDLVKTHPLNAILDQSIAPKTMEQKLLFLADKMVKQHIITVDERFALWRKEDLSKEAVAQLNLAYPRVKALEQEICSAIGVMPKNVTQLANMGETSTMKLSDKGGMS